VTQHNFNIILASIALIASFFSTGCKLTTTTNPVAPSLTTPIKVLTDVSASLTTVSTLVTDFNGTGIFTGTQYAALSKDLKQAENYTNTALALMNAGDTADAQTAITNLGNELITLSNEGALDIKDPNSKAAFDAAVVIAEQLLTTVNV
jgi:hypothetical protein